MNSIALENKKCFVPGDLLISKSRSFQVNSVLGEGAYGTVLKCVRVGGSTPYAIKVIKHRQNHHKVANKELGNLARLGNLDPEKCSIIRVIDAFYDQGYHCMVFEHLDKSLRDYLRQQHLPRLPLVAIKLIVWQLANALKAVNSVGLSHLDLKTDNIMLVNQKEHPFRVKLIDFGLAAEPSSLPLGSTVQTLWYRAPEVMLGLPLTNAVDIWSLGCLAARLYLGRQLYHRSTEEEMLRCIVETQGQPPDDMLDKGVKTHLFFQRGSYGSWTLKAAKQPDKPSARNLQPLKDILTIFPTKDKEKGDLFSFVDLLEKMLHLQPEERITPQKIVKHRFLTSSAPLFTGAQTSGAVKPTREAAPESGEPVAKTPRPQCPTTGVQTKPANIKSKREDAGEISRFGVKQAVVTLPGNTTEDGEHQRGHFTVVSDQRDPELQPSLSQHGLKRKNSPEVQPSPSPHGLKRKKAS